MSRIYFMAASDDGSSWYRCKQPANALTWLGHECRVSQSMTHKDVDWADVIVFSRPAQSRIIEIIQGILARSPRPRVVVDLDDDYFHIDRSNEAAYAFWTAEMLDGLATGIGLADVVVVASDGLRDAIWTVRGRGVFVVENGLHAAWLGRPRDYDPAVITIGWSGSSNTAAWLPQVARAVNKALATYSNTRFLAVGVSRAHLNRFGFDPLPGRVGSIEYVHETERYLEVVSGFDIWLAPYSSTRFTEAKFPTKALEAGIHGIPLVASDVRGYREWICDGMNGFLIRNDHEWSNRLRMLLNSPGERKRVGENARGRASQNVLQSLGLAWQNALLA
jgi:glycosyltransferase involved in cell wall biosynthesis